MNTITLLNGLNAISSETGILRHIVRSTRLNGDPNMIAYGIFPANTEYLSHEKFSGESSGCGFDWQDAILGTIGETVERYAPAFYDINERLFSSYQKLGKNAIHPKEFALFHENQYEIYKKKKIPLRPFTDDVQTSWFSAFDLTTGKETWVPGQFVYMPFSQDKTYINIGTSTGLAAHTNYYKSILNGLFESIERDSFVITWMQRLLPPKIKISKEIQEYINRYYPTSYKWYFFDMTYDLKVPSIFGLCFGEAEFGKFMAVGGSTRYTHGEALKKTIQEIGQAVPYFRYILEEKRDWSPSDDFNMIQNFDEHSLFYSKRQDLWNVFDGWVNTNATKDIKLHETSDKTEIEKIQEVVKLLKNAGCNVLFKDVTTPDIRQVGFFSTKVFVPQLIQLAGSYPFYYNGGERLYSVPERLGYTTHDYDHLNKYPHPFP